MRTSKTFSSRASYRESRRDADSATASPDLGERVYRLLVAADRRVIGATKCVKRRESGDALNSARLLEENGVPPGLPQLSLT